MKICVLCKKPFTEYGNNPWPLATEGECCNKCDNVKVTPARIGEWDWDRGEPTPRGKRIGEGIQAAIEKFETLEGRGQNSSRRKTPERAK